MRNEGIGKPMINMKSIGVIFCAIVFSTMPAQAFTTTLKHANGSKVTISCAQMPCGSYRCDHTQYAKSGIVILRKQVIETSLESARQDYKYKRKGYK